MWHTLLYILGFVETFFGICVHCVKCLKAFQSNWKSVSRIPMHFDFSIDWDLREKVSKNSPAAQFIIHLSRQKRVKTMKGVRKNQQIWRYFDSIWVYEFAQWSDHCFEGLDKLGLNNPRWVNFLTNNYLCTEVVEELEREGVIILFALVRLSLFLSREQRTNGYVNQLMFRKGSHHLSP